jgi:mono/diheme cytochrome c family protein
MTRSRALLVAVAAAAATLLLVSVALGAFSAAAVTINVTARDNAFALSKKTAPVGKVTFVVKNAGKKNHSFQIAGKKTAVIKPGKTARLVVTFTKAGPFAYTSTVAGDAKAGLKGTFKTTAAAAGGAAGNVAAGKVVFRDTGCGACHVFKPSGTTGTVGPNLDTSKAAHAVIVDRVTKGKGTMPSYGGQLTSKQIQDVAAYLLSTR